MQTPVGEHIRKLEERLELLNMQVMENRRALAERNQIESEIRAVNLALSHVCRRASPVRADALHDLVVCDENKSSRNTRVFPHPAVLFSEQTFLSAALSPVLR